MVWLCGADGFKSKWCAVLKNLDTGEFRLDVVPFQDLLDFPENPSVGKHPRAPGRSRPAMTTCTASISPTAPTSRPSASLARRRKSSTTRASPSCCAANTGVPRRSLKRPRPRSMVERIHADARAAIEVARQRPSRNDRHIQRPPCLLSIAAHRSLPFGASLQT